MEWNQVESKKDISNLIQEYCNFHDSCLVSLNYNTGNFVDNNGAMCCAGSEKNELNMIFHSQLCENTLELCFSHVKKFDVAGFQEYYSSEIFECYLDFINDLVPGRDENLIVWSDKGGFNLKEAYERNILYEPMTTYVIAHKLKWRFI